MVQEVFGLAQLVEHRRAMDARLERSRSYSGRHFEQLGCVREKKTENAGKREWGCSERRSCPQWLAGQGSSDVMVMRRVVVKEVAVGHRKTTEGRKRTEKSRRKITRDAEQN